MAHLGGFVALVLTALFSSTVQAVTAKSAQLVLSVSGSGVVSSTGGSPDLNCSRDRGPVCTGGFAPGASLALSAVPAAGYRFAGWRSRGAPLPGCNGTPCKLTKAADTEYVTAVFERAGATTPPLVLYTDITSGPNTGGEGNDGIYLTVFGKNFGNGTLGVDVKVYVNDVEVKRYMNPGNVPVRSRARTDIQQIATQIGTLGLTPSIDGAAPSAALPVKVVVDGSVSNPDQMTGPDPTFTVNPGNIYFVAPTGKDTTSTRDGGGFANPFYSVQRQGIGLDFSIDSAADSGAYGRVRAGDFIVIRSGIYAGVGFKEPGLPAGDGYFMQALNKSGCPIGVRCLQGGGRSSGPITVMAYPGELVTIDRSNTLGDDRAGGAFSGADSARQAKGYGAWWTITGLEIESGFNDGPINVQRGELNPLGAHWRVVNNELTMRTCQVSTKCRAGGIAGNGAGNYWVGNYIHDIYDKTDCCTNLENHGIYIGGDGSYEIAYNRIERIPGGSGIQTHQGQTDINHVHVHHNVVHDIGKHGINLAEGSREDIVIWNNVIYNTVGAGLRMGGTSILRNMRLYNNTFYNTNLEKNPLTGVLTNDMRGAPGQVDIRNNIFVPSPGTRYSSGSNNPDFDGAGTIARNLYFGGTPAAPPRFDRDPRSGDPRFRSTRPGAEDFHTLTGAGTGGGDVSAAVVSVVIDDFDVANPTHGHWLRSTAGKYDIGAYQQ